jgi:hypothetical protein
MTNAFGSPPCALRSQFKPTAYICRHHQVLPATAGQLSFIQKRREIRLRDPLATFPPERCQILPLPPVGTGAINRVPCHIPCFLSFCPAFRPPLTGR